MQLQHRGNPYLRDGHWQRTNLNGTRKDQGSKRIEDTNKSEGCEELFWDLQISIDALYKTSVTLPSY